jgi:hypothetical protein
MTRHHTAEAEDFFYVEDTKTGDVVSSICLIPQVWTYEEIPFGVGRVELVSTNREYRRKGLIRAQFEALHQRSQVKGEMVCAITGIPYFYRQFGYEMTLALGGGRYGYRPHVPKLEEDESEPYTFRLARPEDIPFINRMYDRGRKRSLISCPRSEGIWQYEMSIQHESFRADMTIIEIPEGEPVGFLWCDKKLHGSNVGAFIYELKPGTSWAAVTPSVIRHFKAKGEGFARQEKDKSWESFSFNLGPAHPVYDAARSWLPQKRDPYAWYIRIPDLAGFLNHIRPVLNKRLAASEHAGYQGEIHLDFHRAGIKLKFDQGELTSAEDWQPSTDDSGDLGFPDLTFLHLVCGYRSFEELRTFFPDCYINTRKKPEAAAIIHVLFPKQDSSVLGIV